MVKKIRYRGHIVQQNINNHIMIFKNREMVFHAEIEKKLTNNELKRQVDFYLDILKEVE